MSANMSISLFDILLATVPRIFQKVGARFACPSVPCTFQTWETYLVSYYDGATLVSLKSFLPLPSFKILDPPLQTGITGEVFGYTGNGKGRAGRRSF